MKTMRMTEQAFDELCTLLLDTTMELSNLERAPTAGENLALVAMRALVGLGAVPFDRVLETCAKKCKSENLDGVLVLRGNMIACFGQPEVLARVGIEFATVH